MPKRKYVEMSKLAQQMTAIGSKNVDFILAENIMCTPVPITTVRLIWAIQIAWSTAVVMVSDLLARSRFLPAAASVRLLVTETQDATRTTMKNRYTWLISTVVLACRYKKRPKISEDYSTCSVHLYISSVY